MKIPWLILDVSNLCHRAFHGMRNGMDSADVWDVVQFGFYRDLAMYVRRFNPKGVLLAFDSPSGHLTRNEVYPDYKSGRKKKREDDTEEDKEARQRLRDAIQNIRNIGGGRCGNGYAKSLIQEGYEADDLIALAAQQVDRALIISSDEDLYQCLGPRTAVLSPHTGVLWTLKRFRAEKGIEPAQWPIVKAMAGCTSDSITGLVGIGEKTAIKYLNKELGTHLKTYATIKAPETAALMRRNLKLVRLPMKGSEIITPDPQRIDPRQWDNYMRELEFPSLVGALQAEGDRVWGGNRKKKKIKGGLLDG